MPERVLLLLVDAEICVEIEEENIARPPLRLPIL
jgi:hypothetical protein